MHPGAPESARNSDCRGPDLPANNILGQGFIICSENASVFLYLYFHGLEELLLLPVVFRLFPGDPLDRLDLWVSGRPPPATVIPFPYSFSVPFAWVVPWPLRTKRLNHITSRSGIISWSVVVRCQLVKGLIVYSGVVRWSVSHYAKP
jgi:hypothetical protein